MSELKPSCCQHCESTQIHFERWLEETDHGGALYKVWYRIFCAACGFTPDHWEETDEAVVQYWNTRPVEDKQRAEIARLTNEVKAHVAVIHRLHAYAVTDHEIVWKDIEVMLDEERIESGAG